MKGAPGERWRPVGCEVLRGCIPSPISSAKSSLADVVLRCDMLESARRNERRIPSRMGEGSCILFGMISYEMIGQGSRTLRVPASAVPPLRRAIRVGSQPHRLLLRPYPPARSL